LADRAPMNAQLGTDLTQGPGDRHFAGGRRSAGALYRPLRRN
jgi:hypothetical protein